MSLFYFLYVLYVFVKHDEIGYVLPKSCDDDVMWVKFSSEGRVNSEN